MKNMLKITMLLCLMLAVMLTAAACLPKGPVQQTTPEVTTPETTTPEPTNPAHVHTEEILSAVAATCTEVGKTEGKKCSTCGETLLEQEEIPALGHTEEIVDGKAATCTEAGISDGKKCSVCGEITVAQEEIAALGHAFGDWVETKEATVKQEGEKTRSCTNCGETETVTLPKLDDADKPEDSVLVESIGGKNAGELLEQFAKDFENVDGLYWDSAMSTTKDGVTTQQFISLKIYNGELAILLEEDGVFNGVYFVDGILYMNTNGAKIKLPAGSVDEVLGEGAIDDLLSDMNVSFTQAEIEAAANANIYFENTRNKYVVTIHTTNEESGLAEETKFYFNAEGKLTGVHSTTDEGYAMLSLHSYNEPVEIDPPADADEFILPGMSEVEIPEGAVPVDTVNGMTSLELLEKYFSDFTSSTTFDIEVTMVQTVGGEEVTIREIMKIGEDSLYIYIEMLGEATEMWYVDGVAYMRSGENKVKMEGISYEEFLGEGFWEGMLSALIREMPELYFAYVAESQLYELDGQYFFTVGFSMPEQDMLSYIESLYFDENGRVTSTFVYFTDSEGNEYTIAGIYNSYGEPVTVLPPEDADEYLTEGEITPEEPEMPEAPELPETEEDIYALYTDICTMLQSATSYDFFFLEDEIPYFDYWVAGEDAYIVIYGEDSEMERWIIDGTAYYSDNGVTIFKTELNEDFLNVFAMVEALMPIDPISKDAISNLRCTYDEHYGEVVVWFDIIEENGDMVQCKYALFEWEGYSTYVEIIHTYIEGGEVVGEDYYFFDYVNDPVVEIVLPE